MNAKGLRKKLKNGLIVDKWDLVNIIETQEKAINQLKTDLEFQGNKVAELTRDSIAFHDFFYKHDPMGYQAFYARNIS
jgi:hypothetical protein